MGRGTARQIRSAFLVAVVLAAVCATSASAGRIFVVTGDQGPAEIDSGTSAVLIDTTMFAGGFASGTTISANGSTFYASAYQQSGFAPQGYATSFDIATLTEDVSGSSMSTQTSTLDWKPHGIAIDPSGNLWKIDTATTAPGLMKVDTVTKAYDNTKTATNGNHPNAIALTPDGTKAYVNQTTPANIGTVASIDLTGTPPPTLAPTIIVGGTCGGTPFSCAGHAGDNVTSLAATPDGTTIFAGIGSIGKIGVIDTATDTVLARLDVGNLSSRAHALAVSPDGKMLYAISETNGTVTPITIATRTVGTPISVGFDPSAIEVSPDSKTAYVGMWTAVTVGFNSDGVIVPVDLQTNTAGTPIESGLVRDQIVDIVFVPNQGPTAAFSSTPAGAGSATTFNASGSSDSDGSVARYDWNFGDGTIVSNAGATPSHTYTSAGTFSVRVTLTDNEGCSTSYVFTGQHIACNGTSAGTITHNVIIAGVAPTAPTAVSALAGDGAATVSWSAPSFDGGLSISGYSVVSTPGGKTCTTNGALSCTVTGLTNGTIYTFAVTATNSAGTGLAGTSVGVTPAGTPSAPTGVSALAGNAAATVTWSAPSSDGGAAISAYTVTSTPGSKTCTTTGALTCTVTGLTNGTSYTFAVTATNGAGTGPAGSSSAATPQAPASTTSTTTTSTTTSTTTTTSSSGGQTSTKTVTPGTPTTVSVGTNGKSITIDVPAAAVSTAATVTATTTVTPTGGVTFAAGSIAVQLTVTAKTGAAITQFDAPLDLAFPDAPADVVPAYSAGGDKWIAIPELLAPPSLPSGWPDGWYRTGGVLHILTRHATHFALLTKSSRVTPALALKVSTALRLNLNYYHSLVLLVTPSLPSTTTITLRRDKQAIATWRKRVDSAVNRISVALAKAKRVPGSYTLTIHATVAGEASTVSLPLTLFARWKNIPAKHA